jgi:hypothetical protein
MLICYGIGWAEVLSFNTHSLPSRVMLEFKDFKVSYINQNKI